ncbi:serine hydrolase domain-containing protein [Parasediminibacterium sp. JCM 36343]|uniref:serine hydrolase domain-containing protein n=1 Tax=Parasediminibacterium sp. JCM 36343 TaxID=3374279 RepID=UPI00397D6F23
MIFPILTYILLACNSSPKKPVNKPLAPVPVHSVPLSPKEKEYYFNAIAPLYKSMLLTKGFNGAILAAKNGDIVFEDYHGYANLKEKTPITANTTFHLASISKTFTAMVILRLMEQGRLKLDDEVKRYLPTFPYDNITIKNLLTHRSGLPNYIYFMDGENETTVTHKKNKRGKIITITRTVRNKSQAFVGQATNQDVLRWMAQKRPAVEAAPDRVFKYCNTNYVLLAMIAERVSGIPFPTYMKDSLFTPLGMTNSFVFTAKDIPNYTPSYMGNTPAKLEKFDCIFGDKSVYSTVRDMLQWDKALYAGTFVSRPTLEKAFTGYSNEHRGQHNYGYGWRLLINPGETIVYHNGWWHGNNTVFTRLVKDSATLIILGNKFNSNIYSARKITSVFTGNIDTTRLIE